MADTVGVMNQDVNEYVTASSVHVSTEGKRMRYVRDKIEEG